MDKKSIESAIQNECKSIIDYIRRWEDINVHGCNDPFWSDGCNMNLCRNHIIYAKDKIREMCDQTGINYPDEYFSPTPPEVNNWYMADLKKFPKRVERVLYGGRKAVTKKYSYDRNQLTLSL
jgi:hypothetical protein